MEKQIFLIWGLKEEGGLGVGKVCARFLKWTGNFKSSPDKWQSSSMCKGRAVDRSPSIWTLPSQEMSCSAEAGEVGRSQFMQNVCDITRIFVCILKSQGKHYREVTGPGLIWVVSTWPLWQCQDLDCRRMRVDVRRHVMRLLQKVNKGKARCSQTKREHFLPWCTVQMHTSCWQSIRPGVSDLRQTQIKTQYGLYIGHIMSWWND